jgi:hypothetical protein
MNVKALLLASLFFLFAMFAYFLTNPSYEKSLEAKYYYETGNYKEAYSLASEAFSMDIYNRMASTIMAQSKTSMKYKKYIDEAKKYMDNISLIAAQKSISDADRAKIKMICEIMIDSYKKLSPSVITDETIVKEAAKYYQHFEQLLEQVNR